MIVDVDVNNVQSITENSIIYFDYKSKKFKILSKNQFLKDLIDENKKLKNKIENLQTQLKIIQKCEIEKKLSDFETILNRIIIQQAFDLLIDDINLGNISEPANFDFISKWIFNPTNEIPDGFEKYINIIKNVNTANQKEVDK